MKSKTLVLVAAFSGSLIPQARSESNDPLQGLDFLLGEWHGEQPSQGGDVFRRSLDGKVMIRDALTANTNGTASTVMKTSMTIYSEPGVGLQAIYFDNAGHVIHYQVGRLVAGHLVQLTSQLSVPGPHFRITYSATRENQLTVRFEMAQPGDPVEYKVVAEGIENRTNP